MTRTSAEIWEIVLSSLEEKCGHRICRGQTPPSLSQGFKLPQYEVLTFGQHCLETVSYQE